MTRFVKIAMRLPEEKEWEEVFINPDSVDIIAPELDAVYIQISDDVFEVRGSLNMIISHLESGTSYARSPS